MINILHEAQSILMEANYYIVSFIKDEKGYIAFENNTLFGFLHYYETVDTLLSFWKSDKDKLLKEYSPKFHVAGEKAWNVYTVLLTSEKANEIEFHALQDIEEDLSETRKIARSGVENASDLKSALLSLLPFSYIPSLPPLDIKDEIKKRARDLPEKALEAFLYDDDLSKVVQLLEDE